MTIFQTEAPSARLWPPPSWPAAAAPRVTCLMTGQSRSGNARNVSMFLSRGNKRRLVDSCGHERCFSCIGRNEKCALCSQMAGQFYRTLTFTFCQYSNSRRPDWLEPQASSPGLPLHQDPAESDDDQLDLQHAGEAQAGQDQGGLDLQHSGEEEEHACRQQPGHHHGEVQEVEVRQFAEHLRCEHLDSWELLAKEAEGGEEGVKERIWRHNIIPCQPSLNKCQQILLR